MPWAFLKKLVDNLSHKPDPTDEWGPPTNDRPVLNLDRHSLGDIRPGDAIDRVAKFGRPENPQPTKSSDYCYYSRGFSYSALSDDREVFEILVVFHGAACKPEGFSDFAGECVSGGQRITLTKEVTLDDFVQRFDLEYWRDCDDDETLLFYEFGKIEWQVEFGPDRRLRSINMVSPPLLESAEQRKNYKVDKSWPPAGNG